MLVQCNKRDTKWCPLKEKCPHYKPHEYNENRMINEGCSEAECFDNKDKYHRCKCVKIKENSQPN